MNRSLRKFLALGLMVILMGGIWPVRARAVATAASPIAAGKWTGYFSRDITISNLVSGVLIEASGYAKGDFNLQVDGNGGITGKIENYKGHFEWTITPATLSPGGGCDFTGGWDVTSGTVVEGPAHLPVFDLNLNLTSSTEVCNPQMGGAPASAENKLHFEALTASGGKITGNKFRYDVDQIEMVMSSMSQIGAEVAFTEYWELNFAGASIDDVYPEYEQYFLEGVVFENSYTASVDWHGNPPGTVEFSLGGLTLVSPGEGEVSQKFYLDPLPPGKNPLVVTAISPDGTASGTFTKDVIIVPMDPWAINAGFKVSEKKFDVTQWVVIYGGKTALPPAPQELVLPYLDISAIPFLGGKWGMQPFHVDVSLLATSEGGLSEAAPVTGSAGLYLGKDLAVVNMTVSGQAVTNMTEGALLFDHGNADFTLPPFTLKHTFGLATVIPGVSELYNIKFLDIGKLLQSIGDVFGITLNLTAQATGKGELGAAADKSQLVFTKGDVTPTIGVSANPELNLFGLVSIGFGGGGNGKFMIRIAPDPGLENCWISLKFWAHAKIFKVVDKTFPSPAYQIAQCSPTTMIGQGLLAKPMPGAPPYDLVSTPLAGSASSVLIPLKPVAHPPALQSGAGTVLVSDAAPEANLDLALGPQGRMAFVYTTGEDSVVALRLYDGTTWGAPITIGEAGRSGMSLSAAFDASGQVVAAWVQPGSTGAPAESEIENYARSWEIAYAVIDGSGVITSQGSVTNDDLLDFFPQLERTGDGSIWLAWIQSPGTSLWGPNRLVAARWNGKTWTSPETLSEQVTGALGFRLAAGPGSNAAVAASLDVDGDPQTSADREIFIFLQSAAGWVEQRVTNDTEMDVFPLAAFTPEGTLALAWQRGAALVGLEDDLSASPQAWQVGSDSRFPDLASGELVAGAQGEMALVWGAAGEAGQGVWMARRPQAGAAWEQTQLVVDGLGGTSQLSVRAAENGGILIGMAQIEVPITTQDMEGLGLVSMGDLPASANLAVVDAGVVMQPRPESVPTGTRGQGGGDTGGGESGGVNLQPNRTSLLLVVAAVGGCLAVLAVLVGVLVLARRKR